MTINEQATEQHLTFLGLVGMMDPPRPEVFHAVEQAKQAGIRPIFGPHHGYASSNVTEEILSEFRDMVEAFHAADIEVILDVVYNHTAEGDEAGPIYSFKGIDNSTYYLLESDWRHYCDDTGTGNTLNCANRYVRKMIVDSLKFWVNEMHVDGFRFDLASIFTRKSARPE